MKNKIILKSDNYNFQVEVVMKSADQIIYQYEIN